MINYWLSQSKSIKKDLLNLFIGSYLLHGDYGECTCWVANSSPPHPRKSVVYFQSSLDWHELLKTYFSWKWASPPENMARTRNPHGSSWWDLEWREMVKPLLLPPCCGPLRPAQIRAPSWEAPPHSRWWCDRHSETPWGGVRAAQWSLDEPRGA